MDSTFHSKFLESIYVSPSINGLKFVTEFFLEIKYFSKKAFLIKFFSRVFYSLKKAVSVKKLLLIYISKNKISINFCNFN